MDCAGGKPLLAIDPQGMVFAVALNSKHIRIYDLKNYDNVLCLVAFSTLTNSNVGTVCSV